VIENSPEAFIPVHILAVGDLFWPIIPWLVPRLGPSREIKRNSFVWTAFYSIHSVRSVLMVVYGTYVYKYVHSIWRNTKTRDSGKCCHNCNRDVSGSFSSSWDSRKRFLNFTTKYNIKNKNPLWRKCGGYGRRFSYICTYL